MLRSNVKIQSKSEGFVPPQVHSTYRRKICLKSRREGGKGGKIKHILRFRRAIISVPRKLKAHRAQRKGEKLYLLWKRARSDPQGLSATHSFNPFHAMVPTSATEGPATQDAEEKALEPPTPSLSSSLERSVLRFCPAPPPTWSHTCPGSRHPTFSSRPSLGSLWAVRLSSRPGCSGRRPPAGLAKLAAGQARGAARQSGPAPCGDGAHWPASATWPPSPLY